MFNKMEVPDPLYGTGDLRVAELICSRVCHDLVNPLNAIGAGLELIQSGDSGTDAREAAALAGRSAETMSRRLTFMRAALGSGGLASGSVAAEDLRRACFNFLQGSLVDLDWQARDPAELDARQGRLVLNMVWLGAETLLRGGTLRVDSAPLEEGLGLAILAEGPGVRFHDGIQEALRDTATDSLTPRTIQAYYCGRLAERLNGMIETGSSEPDCLEIACVVSG